MIKTYGVTLFKGARDPKWGTCRSKVKT